MLFDQRVRQEAEASPEDDARNTMRASALESVFSAKGRKQALSDVSELTSKAIMSLRRLDTPRLWTNSRRRRPASSLSSLSFEGYTTRVARRKVVALLATGGVIAASAGFTIYLTGDLFSQQGFNSQQARMNGVNLPKNAALNLVNPADGKAITVIHLTNGNVVAYDRHCTHRGVFIHYDPSQHLCVCPAHGATFDPARDGAVVQGVPQEPPLNPLSKVAVKINADGMIVAG